MIRLLQILPLLIVASASWAAPDPEIIQPIYRKPDAAPPPLPPGHLPVLVRPAIDDTPCSAPRYPDSVDAGEGTVVLGFLIDLDGRVLDSRVDQSSGHQQLDEAARKALALCHFKPGTVDGRPERAWAKIKYNWTRP